MGRAFAGEVWQKEQSFRTGRSIRSLLSDQLIRIHLLLLCRGNFGLAEFVAEPLQTSARRQYTPHDVPFASHGMAEGVQSSLRIDLNFIAVSKHNSAGTHRCRHHTFTDDTVSYSTGCLVSASTDNGCPDLQSHRLCRDR